MVSIADYITERFAYQSGWGSPNEAIDKLAKQFGDELKKRYDIAFATQIVKRMNENGLLKDESIIKLLDNK